MMEFRKIKKWLSPWLDGELEAEKQMELEQLADEDASVKGYIEKEKRIECLMCNCLAVKQETQEAWFRALGNAIPSQTIFPRNLRLGLVGSFLIVFFLLTFTGVHWAAQDLTRCAVRSHERYLNGELPLIENANVRQLEEELTSTLGYPVKIPTDLGLENTRFIGVRMCHLKELPVAYLIYHHNNQPISVFVMNEKDKESFRQTRKQFQEEGLVFKCRRVGSRYLVTQKSEENLLCVLGKINQAELEKFTKAFYVSSQDVKSGSLSALFE